MTAHELGQRVRQRRTLLRLRQRDLAEIAGITLRGLTNLEKGEGNPTFTQLNKIAEVLGLEIRFTEKAPHASSESL